MSSGSGDLGGQVRDVIDALDRVEQAAWAQAAQAGTVHLVGLMAGVCAAQHGLSPLPVPTSDGPGRGGTADAGVWRSLPDLTDRDRAALAFAEQFAVDVSAVTDGQRRALFEEWGDGAATLAAVVFVVDFLPRTRAALDALEVATGCARGSWRGPGRPSPPDPLPLWDALAALIRMVPRLDALDPVTSELVRLRGARQHQCRLCQSLRSLPAVRAGADELFLGRLDDYGASDLSAHQKAALGMVDAVIWTPAHVDGAALQLAANASVDQCAEVVVDITRNALNKIAVALAADAPHVEDGIELYDIGPDGELVYGLTID